MMIRKTVILLLIISSIVLCTGNLQAGNKILVPEKEQIPGNQIADTLKWSVDYLNKLLYSCGEWYLTDHLYKKPIQGLLNYAENDPLDTAVINI